MFPHHESQIPTIAKLASYGPTSEHGLRHLVYLRNLLKQNTSGRRVADFCCSVEHAIGLAAARFQVTAVLANAQAVANEHFRRAEIDLALRWEVVDLLAPKWPLPLFDGIVICGQRIAHHREVDWRRILRKLRYHLAQGGVLIVRDCRSSQCCGISRSYDALDLTSVTRRLREAGFLVLPDPAISSGPETIHIIARPHHLPPASLAVASWGDPGKVRLDLRYAPDEAELLDPPPNHIWEQLVFSASQGGADIVSGYAVDDPYGGVRGAEIVSNHFGVSVMPEQLTFAAGVTAFLHHLCELSDGGAITASELVHGDLESWALARDIEVRLLPESTTTDQLIAALASHKPALLHLDRPTFTGQLISLGDLAELTEIASRFGAVVLIDESASSYLGPGASAVQLINQTDNLVVLRGFTKAYSWGGLRAGFCIASQAVAQHVRELVPPLQISELALQAALKILSCGDIFGRLRARIQVFKPIVIESLLALGLEVSGRHKNLPWVAVSDAGEVASSIFADRGICALRPPPPVLTNRTENYLRLTVPLSKARMMLFLQLLGDSQRLEAVEKLHLRENDNG
jgi:histidinol-phosphate/aromatic aminotransferase/cobyric acid decarboxylase-like protein